LGSRIPKVLFSSPLALPACENLEQLRGDRGSIQIFLPGRRVTSLIWIPSWRDSTGDIKHLAKEFSAIQNFTFHSYGSQRIVGFNTVVPYIFTKSPVLGIIHFREPSISMQ
jgi:hypothetical protein